jgi:hypothetical protein
MKFIDSKYEIQVGYYVVKNHLKDYKIYATMICMFDFYFFQQFIIASKRQSIATTLDKLEL